MTLPSMTFDEILAVVAAARDHLDQRASYLRRRADTAAERQEMITSELLVRDLEEAIGNLRRARRDLELLQPPVES
jgi:hypothetical protein